MVQEYHLVVLLGQRIGEPRSSGQIKNQIHNGDYEQEAHQDRQELASVAGRRRGLPLDINGLRRSQ
jgi:hypothetical protein